MITTQVRLIALPLEWWTKNDENYSSVANFVKDALGIERRIAKGVNLENEYARYSLCCNQIESAIPYNKLIRAEEDKEFSQIIQQQKIPSVCLSEQYIQILSYLHQKHPKEFCESRFGKSFFPPEMLEEKINDLQALAERSKIINYTDVVKKLKFYSKAKENHFGVIELVDCGLETLHAGNPIPELLLEKKIVNTFIDDEVKEIEINSEGGTKLYRGLMQQFIEAIDVSRQGKDFGVINIGTLPHSIISEVFHDVIYTDKPLATPLGVHILYADGSQSEYPIRIRVLPPYSSKKEGGNLPVLRAELLSMRHLEMDSETDFAWFRNRDVSKSRTLAETDTYCYQQTIKQLNEFHASQGAIIHLYQTGLQPAVVGFYRALTEYFIKQNSTSCIRVIPEYFNRRDNCYDEGKTWE